MDALRATIQRKLPPIDSMPGSRLSPPDSTEALRAGRDRIIEIVAAAAFFAACFVVYFSPALTSGRLLAPGDGLIYYVPALLSKAAAWNHSLYAGHPAFADSQSLFWSPLRIFGNYNAAVMAVYVLASTSAYAFVRSLTGMRAAGLLAAIIYGSGGPMMAHLGHLTIIYSAAWMPLMLWSVARARDFDAVAPVAVGAIAIGLSMLGGHPQIFVYVLALMGLYAAYCLVEEEQARRALAVRYLVMFGAGLAIACVQLIPLAELGGWSVREKMTFEEFASFSLDPKGLLLFFFPYVLGDYNGPGLPYFGVGNPTELMPYAGIAALLLPLAAWSARRREREVLFWVAAAAGSLVFALGRFTPLGIAIFHVPGFNQFRAPARMVFVTLLSLAVLSGFGLRAIVQGRLGGIRQRRMWYRAAWVFGVPLAAIASAYPQLRVLAAAKGGSLPRLITNPALWGGIALMAVSAIIALWLIQTRSRLAIAALLAFLTFDLATFGWFYEWQRSAPKTSISPSEPWTEFAREVRDAHGRVVFIDGSRAGDIPARPNLNLLYRLPSASGYGPLILRNYAAVMEIDSTGAIESTDRLQQRMRLAGIGWVIGADVQHRAFRFGGDCSAGHGLTDIAFTLNESVPATDMEITSQLTCAVSVDQDATLMTIEVGQDANPDATVSLRAGRDTAEWAIDRPDVAAAIKHRRPPDFESYPAGDFNGHWFHSRHSLLSNHAALDVARVRLKWMQPSAAGIAIRSIDLIDARNGARHRISGEDLIVKSFESHEERQLPGARWVTRIDATGRAAWLVADVVPLGDDTSLAVIKSGNLPDRREFDPETTALIDERVAWSATAATTGASGTVSIDQWTDGLLSMHVDAPAPRFLVIAESFYPGWTARIDGEPTPIIRTNVAFQGIRVPAGRHTVIFSFASNSMRVGLASGGLGLAVLAAYIVVALRSRRRNLPRTGIRSSTTPSATLPS